MSEIYQFSANTIEGVPFSLKSLQNKVVLIVNTASKCGFTPQYAELQKLHECYRDQGLVILGFPSNDFLFQEPSSNDKIQEFCRLHYDVTFPLFEKIHVRGKNIHPLYQFLVSGGTNHQFKGSVKWNFTKFLLNKKGDVVGRFSPYTSPLKMENQIITLLKD